MRIGGKLADPVYKDTVFRLGSDLVVRPATDLLRQPTGDTTVSGVDGTHSPTTSDDRSFRRDALGLAGFVGVCFGVAASGSFFPPDEWYANLIRPSFAPPNWLFGPVWTVLYLMMSVAAWLVWKASGFSKSRAALATFGVQLLLNATWSALFFGLHRPDLALLEIVILWAAIALTIVRFRQHSRRAAMLLVPYLAWVSFATVLNYGFWSLNSA